MQALQSATGLRELSACQVSHCFDAQAVALSFLNGFKVSYSGDCRPSKRFAEIGKDSTVLIHEATFDDEMQGDAEAKKHSTTSEAIGVGLAMRARRVVLTHFSQRYQKIPVMESLAVDKVKLEDAEDRDLDEPMVDAEAAAVSVEGSSEDVPTDGVAANDVHAAKTNVPDIDETGPSKLPSAKPTSPMIAWKPVQAEQPTAKLVDDKSATSVRRGSGSIVPIPFSATQDMKVCVAFDYMKVKVGEIEYMEKLTPSLLKLYQTGDLDDITEKQAEGSANAMSKNESKGKRAEKPRKSNEEINRGKEKQAKHQVRIKSQAEERDDVRVDAPKEIDIVDEDQSTEGIPRTDVSFDGGTVERSRMIQSPRVRRVMNSDSGQPYAKNGPNEDRSADALSVNRVSADCQDIPGRSRSNRRIKKAADKKIDQQAKSPTPMQTRNTICPATTQMHDHEEQVTTTTENVKPSAVCTNTTHMFSKEDTKVDKRKRSNRGAVAKLEGKKRTSNRGATAKLKGKKPKARIFVEMPYSTFRNFLSHIERLGQLRNPMVEPRGPTSPAKRYLSHPEQCTPPTKILSPPGRSTPLKRCIREPTTSPLKHGLDDASPVSKRPSQSPENGPTVTTTSATTSLVRDTSLHRRGLLPAGQPYRRLELTGSTSKLV